jgi:hypothetical protein
MLVRWNLVVAMCVGHWLVVGAAFGADSTLDKPEFEQSSVDAWHRLYLSAAKRYNIVADDDPEHPFQLLDAPLLEYADLESKAQQTGSMFLWTDEAAPKALGIFWSATWGANDRMCAHEFHSLTNEPLTATIDGKVTWKPRKGGLDFRPLPDSPEVAPTRPLRTAQLIRLADEFDAYHSRNNPEALLRRVEKPIYRYPEKPGSDADGAMFVYFFEEDPEVILLFETTEEDGELIWEYSPIRITEAPARLTYGGEDVWKVPRGTFTQNFLFEETDPYHALFFERRDRQMKKLPLGMD